MDGIVKSTLADQIYTVLRQDIIAQRISCGERLTLKTLKERFNVSSTPIREALNRLFQDELVDNISNVGARVISFTREDVEQLYDFYVELDCLAMKFALKNGAGERLLSELTRAVEGTAKAIEQDDLSSYNVHSELFHLCFFDVAGNQKLTKAADRVRSQFSILALLYQNIKANRSTVHREHLLIYEAVCRGEYEEAIGLMYRHFAHSKEYLLAHFTAGKDRGISLTGA